MTAEIICVGTEILLGNIVNTNAAYLAEKLAASGLDCYYRRWWEIMRRDLRAC